MSPNPNYSLIVGALVAIAVLGATVWLTLACRLDPAIAATVLGVAGGFTGAHIGSATATLSGIFNGADPIAVSTSTSTGTPTHQTAQTATAPSTDQQPAA